MRTRIIVLCSLLIQSFCFAATNISARVEDGLIIASQGNDETSQVVKVKVWGTTRIKGGFYQLDTDPEDEYVVISRVMGSGPFYKLQIIDFRPNGILTWSYDSSGAPKIEGGMILLGYLPNGYQGAATTPVYDRYRLSATGLSKVNNDQ